MCKKIISHDRRELERRSDAVGSKPSRESRGCGGVVGSLFPPIAHCRRLHCAEKFSRFPATPAQPV
jgi:hypothetical protein